MNKPVKKTTSKIFDLIDKALNSGEYLITQHGRVRSQERKVTTLQIVKALRSPQRKHEGKKDKYVDGMEDWNYSIRSKDNDERSLRIIISFTDQMLIITVIVLNEAI